MSGKNLSLLLAKTLATRMCHDLAGPLGGISNGIEFLSEAADNNDNMQQSLSLLSLGSDEGSAKLQIFRLAYGIINQVGEAADITLIKEVVDQYFKHSKVDAKWDVGEITDIDHRTRQILVNLVLIAASTLIVGGNITIKIEKDKNTNLTITAEGQQIKCDEMLVKILDNSVSSDDITPHNVPAYLTIIFTKEYGGTLGFQTTESSFSVTVSDLP